MELVKEMTMEEHCRETQKESIKQLKKALEFAAVYSSFNATVSASDIENALSYIADLELIASRIEASKEAE